MTGNSTSSFDLVGHLDEAASDVSRWEELLRKIYRYSDTPAVFTGLAYPAWGSQNGAFSEADAERLG